LFIAALVGGLLALIAYVDDDQEAPSNEDDLEAAAFSEKKCDFDVPLGAEAVCGTLRVPEDWDEPDSKKQVRLAVAIVHSGSRNAAPDPVVILSGGPGQGLTEGINFSYDDLVAPLLANRDVILVDQRGTGASTPSLSCHEVYGDEDFEYDFDEESPDEEPLEPVSWGGNLTRELEGVDDCRRRLDRRVDTSAYNTRNIARDVETLRSALGYDRWNLWGTSYGTKVALEVIREYPEGVRSAVLDSAFPPEANIYTEGPWNLERALEALFVECAAESRCDRRYPQLDEAFERVVKRLRRSPVDVVLDPEYDDYTVHVDEGGFVAAVRASLYSSTASAYLPAMIFQADKGDFYGAAYGVEAITFASPDISYGMHLAVQCTEEMSPLSQDSIDEAVDAHPLLASYSGPSISFIREACTGWGGDPHPLNDEPVVSNVPVLAIAGQFDPVTPPGWGRGVISRMEHGHFVEFPGMGHAVGLSEACPFQIADDFFADPRKAPDTSCVAEIAVEFD
jgi:pimeloyl-ACP methyl ester carboxylesterase